MRLNMPNSLCTTERAAIAAFWRIITPDLFHATCRKSTGGKAMRNSKLIFPCMIVIALIGARVAKAQDGSASLDDQIENKYSEQAPEKAKPAHEQEKTKVKSNSDGHRKHWWSLPHFHHNKKSDNAAARQPESTMNTKATAAKPTKKAALQQASSRKAASRKSGHAAVARKRNAHTSVTSATPHKKSVAATSNGRKPVHHDCSSANAKKPGCQAAQRRSLKATTSRS
jgi:hypothetical protein